MICRPEKRNKNKHEKTVNRSVLWKVEKNAGMPSISYTLTEKLFRHTLMAVMGSGTREEFIEYVYSMSSRRLLEVPSSSWQAKYDYMESEEEEMTLIKIAPKNRKGSSGDAAGHAGRRKLVFYLTGDGLYEPPTLADFDLCGGIVDHTGCDVWLVGYPLIPQAKPLEIMESVYGIYRRALEEYAPEDITLMGLSSGGALCLGICFYTKEKETGLPLPGRILLQSPPLCSPPTEQQLEKMSPLEHKDVTSGLGYFKYLAAISSFMGTEYLVRPMKYRMEGFPPIDLFYGTHELAYAFLDDFTEKCEREGVKLTVHLGKGMMRCWCLLGKTPEAKQVREEYWQILCKE